QAKSLVPPERLGPVHQRLDAGCAHVLSERLPLSRANHVVLKRVRTPGVVEMRQRQIANPLQTDTIPLGNSAAMSDPAWDVAELDVEYGRLHVVEQRRVAMIVIL